MGSAQQAVQPAIADGIARVRAAGKALGIVATREPVARRWIDASARLVAAGADTLLLGHGAADLLARYRCRGLRRHPPSDVSARGPMS